MADFVPLSDFDFSVRLSTSTMTVKAGQPISVPIMVGTLKGDSRPVALTTSDWQSVGLGARVVPSTVPSGGGALLQITVPPGTPPGSYLFTVRGETEGTFKTSNASLTVIVEPDGEAKDNEDHQEPSQEQQAPGIDSAPGARTKRAVFARPARKAPPRPVPAGQRALMVVVMLVMAGVLAYYLGTQLRTGSAGSGGGMAGTYVGTSTFCINSVMGNAPECGTATTDEIQIDSAGDVLGPVLFGKIDDKNVFRGEARTTDGMTFPMTGTFTSGTLSAKHESSSVTWTITLHKQ
jgi:hypothetical protein